MADIVEPKEHKARRAAPRRLEKSVIDLGAVRFGSSELQKLKIRAVQAEFSSHGKPDLEPCFFDPYPADLLMEPEEGYVVTWFPEYDAPVLNNKIDARLIDNAHELSHYLGTYLAVYKSWRPDDAKDIIAYDSGWSQKGV